MTYELHQGDCLKILTDLADQSIDLVACDLPYQSTACEWDKRIPLERLWHQYQRILKPSGAIVLTADLRLASALLATAPKNWFRYDLIWDKVASTGYLDANRRPLRRHEFIMVFSPKGYPKYNPQMTQGEPYGIKDRSGNASVYGNHTRIVTSNNGQRYPTSILAISNANGKHKGKHHPTQKPIELMDWIIKTYSDPGDMVLDNAMGAGSTGLAAIQADRQFIGIELDTEYFLVAEQRIRCINSGSLD